MSAKETFEKVLATIADKLEDAGTLTVITMMGEYTVKAGNIEPAAAESTIQLVAKTEMKLDGDVINQLPKNPNSDGTLVSKELYEYHQQAIRMGMESRAAFMKGIAELLRAVIPGN